MDKDKNSEIIPEVGKKTSATNFEKKIKTFMINLEFDDVDGARDNFRIGYPHEHQIDVIAGWENTVFVIECKSAREFNKTKNLKKDLYEFKGKIPEIEAGLKKDPTYKKYTNYRYILVVNEKVVLRPEDKAYANDRPSIYLWNEDLLSYYDNLYSYLKPYAKFDLLGEMCIKPLNEEPIRIPAFRIKFGNVNVYNFVMNPKDLLKVSYVARREQGKERYYQRIINKERLTKIAKYINSDGRFPNNIIIAFKEGSAVKFRGTKPFDTFNNVDWPYVGLEFGMLEFPKDYRSCWIIDGQHRLYAFVNTDKWFNMPITAFENLNIEDQCKFFLDINKNQKPVDSDLLWDLNGDMIPSEKDGIISNVVKGLNNIKGSPLFYKIYIPSSGINKKKDLIKMSAICIAIKKIKIIDPSIGKYTNPLFNESVPKRVENIQNSLITYFNSLQNLLPDQWDQGSKGFITSNGGISVMIGLYLKIFERSLDKKGTVPTKSDIEYYLTPLKSIFLNDYSGEKLKQLRLRCTSEGGKKDLLDELVLKIKKATGDNLFGGDVDNIGSKVFRNLEPKLRILVNSILSSKYGENWIDNEKLVPKDIAKRCYGYLEKHNLKNKAAAYTQLTFGPLWVIINDHFNEFKNVFVNNENGFRTQKEFDGAVELIKRLRNVESAHDIGLSANVSDEILLKIHLERINECIDSYLESE